MNKTLDDQICNKYPKMFRDRNKPMNETAMCWGFQCGEGWFDIIDSLCEALTHTYTTSIKVDEEDGKRLGIEPSVYDGKTNYYCEIIQPQVVVDTVKEKFGTLRFYYHTEIEEKMSYLKDTGKYPEMDKILERYYNYFDGIVHMAETLSERTCEVTGLKGEMHVTGGVWLGWYKTLNCEYAKNDPFCVDRNYVSVSSLKKEKTK
jgi:hypothetical protein